MLIYVIVFTILIVAIYFYSKSKTREYFGCGTRADLIDRESLSLFQGHTLPLDSDTRVGYQPMYPNMLPSVDNDEKSARSMYMFAYNKCKPECCDHSPYSCDRGCICLSDKQRGLLSSRGYNNNPQSCHKSKNNKPDEVKYYPF
jgi:hypothetical protein